jgi:hypothetical protein
MKSLFHLCALLLACLPSMFAQGAAVAAPCSHKELSSERCFAIGATAYRTCSTEKVNHLCRRCSIGGIPYQLFR